MEYYKFRIFILINGGTAMSVWISLFIVILSFSSNAEKVTHGEFLGGKNVDVLPTWFKTTFMEFADDIDEATEEGRHVMIYFHQNGCPYCAKLVEDNFHDEAIVAKLKEHFDVIETNMWGDRDLVDWEDREFTEKQFSAFMKVQFTPTVIFLDSNSKVVLRLNGYQSITKFHTVLDFISTNSYKKQSFASFVNAQKKNTGGKLNDNKLFGASPHILARNDQFPSQDYLAVFFEEPNCPECDDLHKRLMSLDENKNAFSAMQVIQLNAISDEKLITPAGKKTTASKWYEDLSLTYKPAIVLFDKSGKEIIRVDAMFKAYHFNGVLTYVLSEEYKTQPNFQRYLEGKSDILREKGVTIDIWK
jgi:thioredoxin-related protein